MILSRSDSQVRSLGGTGGSANRAHSRRPVRDVRAYDADALAGRSRLAKPVLVLAEDGDDDPVRRLDHHADRRAPMTSTVLVTML